MRSLALVVAGLLVASCQRASAPGPPTKSEGAVAPAAPSVRGPSVAEEPSAPPAAPSPSSPPGPVSSPRPLVAPSASSASSEPSPPSAPGVSTVYLGPVGRHAVDVRRATALVLHDTWNGLGLSHAAVIALQRSGTGFTYVAKVSTLSSGIGAPARDPYVVLTEDMPSCTCRVQQTCACEHDRKATRRQGRIDAATVDEFLAALAARPLDTTQSYVDGHVWTDDYPFAHVSVSAPSAPAVHFSALDQQRHWRRDGKFLAQDREELGARIGVGAHRKLNMAFQKLLGTLGVSGWVRELYKGGPAGGDGL